MNGLVQNIWSKISKIISCVHHMVTAIEPWSILIAIVALVITLVQLNEDRKIREAILIGLTLDRIDAAREMDYIHDNMARYNVGQTRMIEIMIESGTNVRGMNFSYLNLQNIQLEKADLKATDFTCVKLIKANLAGTNLSEASLEASSLINVKAKGVNFTGVNLRYSVLRSYNGGADFNNADFNNADFNNTALYGLDLSKANGITDGQVSAACGERVKFPAHITTKLKRCNSSYLSKKQAIERQVCEERKSNSKHIIRHLK